MSRAEVPAALPETVDVQTLRRWLQDGIRVEVLDVRPARDRADWSIPGSVHLDAHDALWAQDPAALDGAPIRADGMVVTVCGAGRTSLLASRLLRSRGVNAASLDGGMKAWSGAWNLAEVPVGVDGLRIVQVRRTGKGCLSYVVGAGAEATVIDASVDPEVYLGIARQHGWVITTLVETHVHADHLSRAHALRRITSGRLIVPAQERVSFPHTAADNGYTWEAGAAAARMTALHTPGHTGESMCILLAGRWLFTGDTLFLDSVGRPDLEGGAAEAAGHARDLFRSLARIRSLSKDTVILPAHTSAPIPFDQVPCARTLGEVESRTPLLAADEASFVQSILAGLPPAPANFSRIVEINERGEIPADDQGVELEAGANRCAVGVAPV